MTTDRLTPGYQPDFDLDLAFGAQGELFVTDIAAALRDQTIEVKTDAMALRTGNVYVEFECKGRPSGIATTKAAVWAFVIGSVLVAVPTETLRTLCRNRYPYDVKALTRGSHPTRGVTIPIRDLTRLINETENP